ncbi:MAG: hypothetical protein Satyrvirus37_4 [Satyrvirus sp.]|uniref:Uncharacterized protein n=1 Tax=Satyrvirus sp. TaxID=2487771 RepID=A0A3G5AJK6_9VIRU|nr:MAG: hypothetical protein Satyrvirus37_4 [Satyrvirus sp.]
MTLTKLGIIGISGRTENDINRLSPEHMVLMANKIGSYIKDVIKTSPKNIILVSGGSAWADHVAVQLFLTKKFANLELYLPTTFDVDKKKFITTSSEGRTLNFLHNQCYKKIEIDVLDELAKAIKRGAQVCIYDGFLSRNTMIAKNVDYLVAFTFENDCPKSGGTYDTWKKVKHNNKINFNLNKIEN